MINLSIQAVITLTEWSERTIRRRLAENTLKSVGQSGSYNKTLICFDSIREEVCIPLTSDDIRLVQRADSGDAEAQMDVALLFFSHGKMKSALYWLEAAAKQNYPDAMQWLGECYLRGEGVPEDENIAVMWIAKAAAQGHLIAMRQIEAMRPD